MKPSTAFAPRTLDVDGNPVVRQTPSPGPAATPRAPRKNGIPTAEDIARLFFALTGKITPPEKRAKIQADLDAKEADWNAKAGPKGGAS